MSVGEVKGFLCESNAKGISLKITVKGKQQLLTLCEVFIFGTGMDEFIIVFAINSLRI